jgi:hypothetical protein
MKDFAFWKFYLQWKQKMPAEFYWLSRRWSIICYRVKRIKKAGNCAGRDWGGDSQRGQSLRDDRFTLKSDPVRAVITWKRQRELESHFDVGFNTRMKPRTVAVDRSGLRAAMLKRIRRMGSSNPKSEIEGSRTRRREFQDILEAIAENQLANWILCIKPQA